MKEGNKQGWEVQLFSQNCTYEIDRICSLYINLQKKGKKI